MKVGFAVVILVLLALAGCQPKEGSDCQNTAGGPARNNCYYEFASNSTSAENCTKITSSPLRSGCFAQVAINNNSSEACIQAQDPKSVGYCYAQISINMKDMALCQQTPDNAWRLACIKQVAMATNQSESCRSLPNEDRDECFGAIAEQTKDSAICEEVLKGEARKACHFKVAIAALNESKCPLTESATYESMCYTQIAAKTGNSSICLKIRYKEMSQACLDLFNSENRDSGAPKPAVSA